MGLNFGGKRRKEATAKKSSPKRRVMHRRNRADVGEPADRKAKREVGDTEVVDITKEDIDSWEDEDDSAGEFKFQSGENIFVILPPLKRFGIVKPWVHDRTHFLGKDIKELLGFDIPDGIPIAHGCGIVHGDGTCEWENQIRKLKKARSRRDQGIGKALWAQKKFIANIINLKDPKESRRPQWCRYGVKVQKVLKRALKDGEIFCSVSGLIPIRVIKTGANLTTRYETKVLVAKPRVKLLDEWLSSMHDLTTFAQPVATSEEVRGWMEQLLAGEDYGDEGSESADNIDY